MMAPDEWVLNSEEAFAASLYWLCMLVPVSALLWMAAGRLKGVKLQGFAQQLGLLIPLFVSAVAAVATLAAFVEVMSDRQSPPELFALLLAAAAEALTMFASIRAAVARREAIATRLPERVADAEMGRDGAWADAGMPWRRSASQVARSGRGACVWQPERFFFGIRRIAAIRWPRAFIRCRDGYSSRRSPVCLSWA